MNRKKILLVKVGIFIILFHFSCQDNTHQQNKETTKFKFNPHLQSEGKYYYTLSNETTTTFEVNDKETTTGNKSDLGFIYELQQDSSGNHLLKLTYDKLHVVLKGKDTEQELDADKGVNSSNPVEKLLNTIKDNSLYVTLNEKGEVLNISGSKEITDKVLNSIYTQDENTRKTIQDQLQKLVGDDFIKNNLTQNFSMFPDSAIHVGDSWNRKVIQKNDLKLTADTKYTFTSIAKGAADIQSTAHFNADSNTTVNVMGYPIILSDLEGDEQGIYKIDTATGMATSYQSTNNIKGTVQVIGKEVPVTIKIIRKMTTRKL